jgi:hypothetical protein
MRDHEEGAVVGEVSDRAPIRTLSLRPGRYFVRARATDVMFEGFLDATAGERVFVDPGAMKRIEYARLVRKGAASSPLSHALEAGFRARSALPNADVACLGGFLGYALDFEELGLRARVGACAAGFENSFVEAVTHS